MLVYIDAWLRYPHMVDILLIMHHGFGLVQVNSVYIQYMLLCGMYSLIIFQCNVLYKSSNAVVNSFGDVASPFLTLLYNGVDLDC